MGFNNFQREENDFAPIPEGAHRIRINSVEMTKSKTSRNEMLAFKFDVSGYNSMLFHYIVDNPDNPKFTNRKLTEFFDSFPAIQAGNVPNNLNSWVGKVGACMVKHEEYNGKTSAKVHYFISADKAASLPPWREASGNATAPTTTADGFVTMPQGDSSVPFVF